MTQTENRSQVAEQRQENRHCRLTVNVSQLKTNLHSSSPSSTTTYLYMYVVQRLSVFLNVRLLSSAVSQLLAASRWRQLLLLLLLIQTLTAVDL